MKYDYTLIKNKLLKEKQKTTHFTKAFLKDFLRAADTMQNNIKNNINDSYYSGNVLLFRCYDPVYNSKFYTLNSCAYCVFLEIINSLGLWKNRK